MLAARPLVIPHVARAKRARSHAHARLHGRLMVHVVVIAITALVAVFAARVAADASAPSVTAVPSFPLSGVRAAAATGGDTFLRAGVSHGTSESIVKITPTSEVAGIRATENVASQSSFTAGMAAAAAVSDDEEAGVRPLAEVIDPLRPYTLYTIRPGDSLGAIADRYGVIVGTILDNNFELDDSGFVEVGQEILIPRADGILHKAAHGESISSIVDQYDNISFDTVVAYRPNAFLDSTDIEAGRFVLLPGAERKPPPPPPVITPSGREVVDYGPPPPGNGIFNFPLAGWSNISDPFGTGRGAGRIHEGIDLDLYGFPASPVYAACSGTVIRTEWLTYSYGYHVVIDCGEGWTTLYAHFSEIIAVQGSFVSAGDMIGVSGSTGFSTGEHLHFEIRQNGVPYDPAAYLGF